MAKKSAKSAKTVEPRFKGKTFFIAGRFEKYSRFYTQKQLESYVLSEGGLIGEKLDVTTDYLLLKEASGSSSHEKKATQLNAKGAAIAVITPEQLHQMIVPTQAEVEMLLCGGKQEHARLKGILETASIGPRSIDPYAPPYTMANLSLKGTDITGLPLWCANYTNADLRETTMTPGDQRSDSPRLGAYSDSKFDRSKLRGIVESLDDCSCREVDFDGVWVGGYRANTRCFADFTKSSLRHIHLCYADCSNSNFSKCNMEGANFEETKVHNANFSGAILRELRAKGADFTGCDFSKADLSEADLIDAKIDGCNLSGAKLHKAIMTNTSLKNATLTGADFSGTNVATVSFEGCDLSKCKGLKIVSAKQLVAGQHLKALMQLCVAAKQFSTSIEVQNDDLHLRLDVQLDYNRRYKASWSDDLWATTLSNWATHKTNLADALMAAVAIWPGAKPLAHTVQIECKGTGANKKKLLEMARAAWCETFGVAVPNDEELKAESAEVDAGKQSKRQAWIAKLDSPEGIEQWNQQSFTDIKELNPFRNFDLSGKKLDGLELRSLHLDNCNFENASLVGAELDFGTHRNLNFTKSVLTNVDTTGSEFEDCDFTAATLKDVTFNRVQLRGSTFDKVDLKQTRFIGADLRGASLANAKNLSTDPENWEGSKYDETTKFPAKFKVPASVNWIGKGADPRAEEAMKQIKASGPIDLEQFMELLNTSVDKDRLKKAVSMLKAERFRLFAEADAEHLVGVVKSQSDAELVYSCRLASDGTFSCCTQNLNVCGGLRGALCKHLLVLIIGMTKGGELDPTSINQWIQASKFKKPELDKEAMSATLLKYKGAEAGEIDWRPMETIPEDFYAL
jgi:uncharacterized protein YjbI with pentapeptide repeats